MKTPAGPGTAPQMNITSGTAGTRATAAFALLPAT